MFVAALRAMAGDDLRLVEAVGGDHRDRTAAVGRDGLAAFWDFVASAAGAAMAERVGVSDADREFLDAAGIDPGV